MTSLHPSLSRRRLLQAAGIGTASMAGLSVLTACRGGSADGVGARGDGAFIGSYEFNTLEQGFNPVDADNTLLLGSCYSELFYPRPGLLNWGTNEWEHMLAESSGWDGDVFTITVRSGVKWNDGTDVTVDDFLGSLTWAKLSSPAWGDSWPLVSKIEQAGDNAVALTFDGGYPGVEFDIMKSRIHPTSRYGDLHQKAIELFNDGVVNADDEQLELADEFTSLSFTEFVSCGPYQIDQVGETQITLKPHPEGLFGDQVKFEKIIVEKADNGVAAQLLAESKIDYATHVFGPSERKLFADVNGLQEFDYLGKDGCGVMLSNSKRPELADPRVRKALMHITKGDEVGKIAVGDGAFFAPQYNSGLSDAITEEVLSADQLATLDAYEFDEAKATAYLEEAGWSKDGDAWLTPDGEPAEYELVSPEGWNDFILTGEQIAEQWSAFGIKVTAVTVPEANIWGIWDEGDYDIATRHWGNPFIPAIAGAWRMNWFTNNNRTKEQPGMNVETEDVESTAFGKVDIKAVYDVARADTDEAKRNEANAQLAIIFNETLPRLPIWGFTRASYGIEGPGVKEFAFDDSLSGNDKDHDNPVMASILYGTTVPAE